MRITSEYLSLQHAYDPARLHRLVCPDRLSTARFESVYREMSGFGMLDLVFEEGDDVFVVHNVGVDIVVLATREGPSLLWPATLSIAPDVADATEVMLTPWLRTLLRGRGVAGEYVRAYRPSSAFALARERRFRGAVPTGETLPLMSPFVYARRFARERDVFVGCAQRSLAAAVLGTVARSITLGGTHDAFAERWYGRPILPAGDEAHDVAIVDDVDDPRAARYAYVVATRASQSATDVVIPIPVPQDHLFTFDAADAPAASRFGVRARDFVDRPIRVAQIPAALGGSAGSVALVVRDDAAYAPDADTDSVDELARRLRGEGLDVAVMTAGDARLRDANIVHIFGGVTDTHIGVAADIARAAGVPFVVSLEPIGPYSGYAENASIMTLRIPIDDTDRRMYRAMFDELRLRFDELPHELTPEMETEQARLFEAACRGASGIILSPTDDEATFRTRFGGLATTYVASAAGFVGPEPQEMPVETLIPARPFLLLHGPLTRRSDFGNLLASLGESSYDVVVAGPVSEVDIAFTLRRVSGSHVVFLPDPTPGQVAGLYRRARAVAFPALRPTGVGRLIRAVMCGALPLVPISSPLSALLPPACLYEPKAASTTRATFEQAMINETAATISELTAALLPASDQVAAFRAVIDTYARIAVPAQP